MILRGVDGCTAGWIAASLDLETGRVTGEVFRDAVALLRGSPAAVTAIDIPIGLPSGKPRSVDGEARKLLRARASSVFPAPDRATLTAQSYEEACALSQAACGKSMSRQGYGIHPKINAVDTLFQQDPGLRGRVFEVHPELCFFFLAEQKPMRYPKHSGFGFVERFELLHREFGRAAEEIREGVRQAEAGDDDILDALAALWTARRIHAGNAVRLPKEEECDACGIPMQMLA